MSVTVLAYRHCSCGVLSCLSFVVIFALYRFLVTHTIRFFIICLILSILISYRGINISSYSECINVRTLDIVFCIATQLYTALFLDCITSSITSCSFCFLVIYFITLFSNLVQGFVFSSILPYP